MIAFPPAVVLLQLHPECRRHQWLPCASGLGGGAAEGDAVVMDRPPAQLQGFADAGAGVTHHRPAGPVNRRRCGMQEGIELFRRQDARLSRTVGLRHGSRLSFGLFRQTATAADASRLSASTSGAIRSAACPASLSTLNRLRGCSRSSCAQSLM